MAKAVKAQKEAVKRAEAAKNVIEEKLEDVKE